MFYPVFLSLAGKQVVIIGGGAVAERKAESLAGSGAAIKLISPRVTSGLRELAASGEITIHERPYATGDCAGAFLVISATGDPTVQKAVWQEADSLGILVNTADEPELCNVIMPAVLRRGDLTVAISTAGKSPALAARLREKIAGMLGPEYGRLLQLLGRYRPEIRERFAEGGTRKGLHYRIVDSEILALLSADDAPAAEKRLREIIEEWQREEVLG